MAGMNMGDRRSASKAFWDSANRNKMGNPDSIWGGVVDVQDARARALGLPPIRDAQSEAAADAARLKRAREHYRRPGPLDFANTDKLAPYTAPENGGGGYTKANPPRMQPGSNVFSPGSGDHEALLTRARNGYYLNKSERDALVGHYGQSLPGMISDPAGGAAHRKGDWSRRTDRLTRMANALGINMPPAGAPTGAPAGGPVAGGAAPVSAPTGLPAGPRMGSPTSGTVPVANQMPQMPAGQAPGGLLPENRMNGGNAQMAGPSPYTVPGSVASPGYQNLRDVNPITPMLSGKDYIQNRAQVERLARGYRRSGMNPMAAQAMAQQEQDASRAFMTQAGLLDQMNTNDANAGMLDYNQGIHRNQVGENLGLGQLGLSDASRRDAYSMDMGDRGLREKELDSRIKAGEREAEMRDKLMGALGMGGGGGGSEWRPPMAAPGQTAAAGGQSITDPMTRAAMMDYLLGGQGRYAAAAAETVGRGDRPTPAQAAAVEAAKSGNPDAMRWLQQSGVFPEMNRGGMNTPAPPRDAQGNPEYSDEYIADMLDRQPAEMTPQQKLEALQSAGIPRSRLEEMYDGSGAGLLDRINNAMSWAWLPDFDRSARVSRMNRANKRRSQLGALLGEQEQEAPAYNAGRAFQDWLWRGQSR